VLRDVYVVTKLLWGSEALVKSELPLPWCCADLPKLVALGNMHHLGLQPAGARLGGSAFAWNRNVRGCEAG